MYEAWPSNKIRKNFFFFFHDRFFFLLVKSSQQNSEEFFSGLRPVRYPFISHSLTMVQPTRLSLSSVSASCFFPFPPPMYCQPNLSHSTLRSYMSSSRLTRLPPSFSYPSSLPPRFVAPTSLYVLDKVSMYETSYRSSFLALLGAPGIQCSWWVVCVSYLRIYVFVSGCLWVPVAPTPIYLCRFLSQAKFEISISLCRVCSLSSPHRPRPVNRPLSPCFSFLYYVSTVSPLSSFHRVSP